MKKALVRGLFRGVAELQGTQAYWVPTMPQEFSWPGVVATPSLPTKMGGVERGERNVAMVNVARIVAALGMKPSDFFKALDGTIVADHEEKGP